MRNLLLFLATAAVLGGLFWGYSRLTPAPPTSDADEAPARPLPQGARQPPGDELVIEGSRPGDKRATITPQVGLSPGEHIEFVVYDERTHRPVRIFRCAKWTPVSDAKDTLDVEQPEVEVLLPSGLVAKIRADGGRIVLNQGSSKLDLRRGALDGATRLILSRPDFGSATQPATAREMPDEITIDLQRVEFDVDLGFIKSPGAVHAVAEQFELRGEGLELLWNRADNRIEKLTLARGGSLTLMGGGLPAELGGTRPAGASPTTSAPGAKPARPAGESTIYQIDLDGPVLARQMRGDQELGRLDAERLKVAFELGSRARAAPSESAAPGPAAPASQPATTRSAPSAGAERLVVTWAGPLHLAPDTRSPRAGQRVQRVEAFGAPVVWKSAQILVRGSRLEYDGAAQRLWVDPLAHGSVEIELPGSAVVTTAGVYIDRAADLVKLIGPLRLESLRKPNRTSQPLTIECTLWATLALAAGDELAQAEPGASALGRFGELEKATFVGEVHVMLSGRALDADRLDTVFRAADGDDSLEARLESSEASGAVRLRAGQQRMACDHLALSYSRDADGEIFPRSVQGRGAVSLSDRGGKVSARGRLVHALLDRADQVRHARIVGTPTHWAYAAAAPFHVWGEVIELDPPAQRLEVNGPSRASFPARRSLRGAERSRPTPVLVNSRESLRIDGKENLITLTGDVRARTGDEQLLADGLTIVLEDAQPGGGGADGEREVSLAAAGRNLGALQFPLARVPATIRREWAHWSARARPPGAQPVRASGNQRKEPVRLLARQARLQSVSLSLSNAQPLLDQQLSAPEMEVDVRTRTIRTTGMTTLEMLDLRLPVEDGVPAGDALGLPSALVSRGPSHTAMVCTRGMIYRVGVEGTGRRDSVLFEGSVRFVHLTGREIVDLATLLPELAGDPQRLAGLKSRNFRTWCERLECVFAGDTQTTGGGLAADGLRLESLIASGETYVRDQIGAGIREIWARHVEFDRPNATVRVRGGDDGANPARIDYSNTQSQRMETIAQGPDFVIDLNNNAVRSGPTSGGGVRP